jgi:hypothetical protein
VGPALGDVTGGAGDAFLLIDSDFTDRRIHINTGMVQAPDPEGAVGFGGIGERFFGKKGSVRLFHYLLSVCARSQ